MMNLRNLTRTAAVPQTQIVLIGQATPTLNVLSRNFSDAGYAPHICSAANAPSVIARKSPQVVILDTAPADQPDLALCRQICATYYVPIIVLLAHNSVNAIVAALESGADACLVKPVAPREMVARVQAILRRPAVFAAHP